MTGELVPKPTPRLIGETPATGEYVCDLGEGVQTLIDHGMLWALNVSVLHPRGYQIRSDGLLVTIAGHGKQAIEWEAQQARAADHRRRQFEQTLLHAYKYNNPGHWDGHSPGFSGRQAAADGHHMKVRRGAGRRVGG